MPNPTWWPLQDVYVTPPISPLTHIPITGDMKGIKSYAPTFGEGRVSVREKHTHKKGEGPLPLAFLLSGTLCNYTDCMRECGEGFVARWMVEQYAGNEMAWLHE